MKKVSFSIIVPIYNVEQYLTECIDSVLGQKDCEFELILVDDGSTDSSGQICDDYALKDSRIHVIHKENGGASDARNVGVRMAKCDYILFVDSDDYIASDSIKSIGEVICHKNFPDLVFLECVKAFRERIIPMYDGVTEEVNTKTGDEIRDYIAKLPKYPASPWSKAIRREFYLNHELYFKDGILAEDLEWAVRLFLAVDTAAYCPAIYYYYRQQRRGSRSSTFSKKQFTDIMQTVSYWCGEASEETNSSKHRMICSLMEYVFRFLLIGVVQIKDGKKEAKNKIRSLDWILGSRQDKVSRMICMTYRIFGIELTGRLLKIYLKLRERFIT
ncbi:MAG: glycosyltransferase family 2 protein [Lachnospiraceae bacterium]|nr:glycosyltransferase family 2 protein [Lachnospiraceae bacterium]